MEKGVSTELSCPAAKLEAVLPESSGPVEGTLPVVFDRHNRHSRHRTICLNFFLSFPYSIIEMTRTRIEWRNLKDRGGRREEDSKTYGREAYEDRIKEHQAMEERKIEE